MIVTAYLKDGRTALQFEDAAEYRRLLHSRPGHKPHGGEVVEATEWRWRQDKMEWEVAGKTTLRYIHLHTVAWVGQGPPLP